MIGDTEKSLRAVCKNARIPFDEKMLTWEAKELDSWKKFDGWHDDASKSTGFQDTKCKEVSDGNQMQ